MAVSLPSDGLFQTAYVVADLAAAIESHARYGIDHFHVIDTRQSSIPRRFHNLIALAWLGDMMVELIQPLGERQPLYDVHFDDRAQIAFHHLGYLVRDEAELAAMRTRCMDAGFPIVAERATAGRLAYFYTDTRAADGHYREYVHVAPGAGIFDAVPRFPATLARVDASGAIMRVALL